MTTCLRKLWFLAILFLSFVTCIANERNEIPSPRIRELEREILAEKGARAAIEAFWKSVNRRCPLTEEIKGDDDHLLVTFLWRGDATTHQVEVRGGPFASSREPFSRLAESDVWYRCERLPKDSRYVYGIVLKRQMEHRADDGTITRKVVEEYPNDPLNPHQFNGGPTVELPEAPADSWHVARQETPKGRVERVELTSEALNEKRILTLYVPDGFDPSKKHALAVFFDGEECETLMSLPTTMDNLIANKKILPTIVVMVHSQGKRGRDLVFFDPFVKFCADEIVPWTVDKYKLKVSAKETVIGGMSLGGLTAAYAAHHRPKIFGNVLSQSGAFWRTRPGSNGDEGKGWLPEHVAATESQSVRYYLECGQFESPSMIENNRRLRDALKAKGNAVTFDEYNGGHDHFNWRVSVGRGLMSLIGTDAVR